MSKRPFSKDEQLILSASPDVETVTEKCVIFTPEFKEKAYQALLRGERMAAIFEEHGIQPSILGNARINLVTGIYPLPMYRKDGHRGLCPRTPAVYRFAFQEGSRAAAQEKATRPSSPPSRKSGEALGSLLSVALSSAPAKREQYITTRRGRTTTKQILYLTWGTLHYDLPPDPCASFRVS